jgi:hypothetical protein
MEATLSKATHPCIVPSCQLEGRNKLGIRCRVWHDGPYLHGKARRAHCGCRTPMRSFATEHALSGATITMLYEPDGSKETTIRVIGAKHVEPRSVPIKETRQ